MTATTTTATTTAIESATTATTSPTDTFDNGRRGRFNAWFFTAFDRYVAHISRRHKRVVFGDLQRGDVVEIGAGVGANFEYVAGGTRLIAIEPNLAMHQRLVERASERGLEMELLSASAQRIPFPDACADDVLCSLVLCTVDDPGEVLGEVRRILRPGGRFRFVEHVAAPAWSPRRWVQLVLRRPWRWLYEGCDLCRDTATVIGGAGFSDVSITRRRMRHSLFFPCNTAISGVAVR